MIRKRSVRTHTRSLGRRFESVEDYDEVRVDREGWDAKKAVELLASAYPSSRIEKLASYRGAESYLFKDAGSCLVVYDLGGSYGVYVFNASYLTTYDRAEERGYYPNQKLFEGDHLPSF